MPDACVGSYQKELTCWPKSAKQNTDWIMFRYRVNVGGSILSPPPPPFRVMRAYQTFGHLPVAVQHAFVVIRPTTGVGTSADAICGIILASRRVRHCFCP
jgi:hypothetical protein